jgi:hypothetical protein
VTFTSEPRTNDEMAERQRQQRHELCGDLDGAVAHHVVAASPEADHARRPRVGSRAPTATRPEEMSSEIARMIF